LFGGVRDGFWVWGGVLFGVVDWECASCFFVGG
jgi:hypothetical protein